MGAGRRGNTNVRIASDAFYDHVAAHTDGIREIGTAGRALELEEKGMVRRHADTRNVFHLCAREKINHSAGGRRTAQQEEEQQGAAARQLHPKRDEMGSVSRSTDSQHRWPARPCMALVLAYRGLS